MSKGWITIEGIISAGKSEFLKAIKTHIQDKNVLFIPEPVDQWVESGHLAASTTEAYCAQTFFFHTRIELFVKLLEQSPDVDYIISERSFQTDYLFWKLSCENGLATDLEQKTYPLLWKTWSKLLNGRKPTKHVYLKLDVKTAQKRLAERNRTAELSTVTDEYQQQLFEMHEKEFIGNSIVLDASRNFRDNPQIVLEMVNKIF